MATKKNKKVSVDISDVVAVESDNVKKEWPVAFSKSKKSVGPTVINMDDIAVMLDDELYQRFNMLNSSLAKAHDKYVWEIELAYVQREIGIRRDRRSAHEKYVSTLQRYDFARQVDERNLPAGNFDNIKSVN